MFPKDNDVAAELKAKHFPNELERHALVMLAAFPDATVARTSDVFQFDIGGNGGCVVVLTRESADVRLPFTEWNGPHSPSGSSRHWKHVLLREDTYSTLFDEISEAIRLRRSEYQRCVLCGKEFAPEHMTHDACHGCSERYRGIVY